MEPTQIFEFLILNPWLLFILIAWTLFWKGMALWMSARREQKNWFVALLVLNTVGILEIIYILITKNKEKPEPEQPKANNAEEN